MRIMYEFRAEGKPSDCSCQTGVTVGKTWAVEGFYRRTSFGSASRNMYFILFLLYEVIVKIRCYRRSETCEYNFPLPT